MKVINSSAVKYICMLALLIMSTGFMFRNRESNKSQPKVITDEERRQQECEDNEWTDRNINKRPDLYLSWLRDVKLPDELSRCEDNIFSLNVRINIAKEINASAQREIKPMLEFLRIAKDDLKDDNSNYPKQVGLYWYDSAEELEKACRTTHAKIIEIRNKAVSALRDAEEAKEIVTDLESKRSEIVNLIAEIQKIVPRLSVKDSNGEVQEIGKRVEKLRAQVNAIKGKNASSDKEIGKVPSIEPSRSIDELYEDAERKCQTYK